MEHKPLKNEDRARIARGWRPSGQTQPTYAALHGITDRTLRMWVARWAPPCTSGTEVVRDVCERAIERLRALVDALGEESTGPAVAGDRTDGTRAPSHALRPEPQGSPRGLDFSNLGM